MPYICREYVIRLHLFKFIYRGTLYHASTRCDIPRRQPPLASRYRHSFTDYHYASRHAITSLRWRRVEPPFASLLRERRHATYASLLYMISVFIVLMIAICRSHAVFTSPSTPAGGSAGRQAPEPPRHGRHAVASPFPYCRYARSSAFGFHAQPRERLFIFPESVNMKRDGDSRVAIYGELSQRPASRDIQES